jgi:hypothetical protein
MLTSMKTTTAQMNAGHPEYWQQASSHFHVVRQCRICTSADIKIIA